MPIALTRPICISKALTKMAVAAEDNKLTRSKYQMERQHIDEEIEALEKDLRYMSQEIRDGEIRVSSKRKTETEKRRRG